ncbi:hypothetical protein AMS68_005511 [Peltaster fructicola]|uniref:Uncharacterized protein n=1 Tax=Peltaster fructicola TaxID=286661 RepID=A0A6H0XZ19_9PEZI|nr:hypothetical protein AMS68_005511 [Peltaster fructicola]
MSGKRRADRQGRQNVESNAPSPTTSHGGASDSRRGSAAASLTDIGKPQIDFQFLNFSHPSEAKTGKTRKAVRSHVTRQQHQRENAAAAARRAKEPQAIAQDTPERPLPLRPSLAERSTPSVEAVPQLNTTAESPGTSSAASMSPMSPATSPMRALHNQIDPTEVYPQEWHPYIGRILEHYVTYLVNATDLTGTDDPDPMPLLRTRWFPFVMTDPAPMHAVMLVAASHYGRARGPRAHAIDLLQLRGMAIHEINNALEDPVRALSDQLIAAVAKMAAYEALFGDRSTYNTHMTGLLRMVSLRGGLPALGLEGLLERVLLWIDVNASHVTASHIYFDKAAFPTSAVHPRPDPSRFFGGLV